MTEIEKMKRYIERTPMSAKTAHNYALDSVAMCAFYDELKRDQFHAIATIYSYGRAKGYRAARGEARR